MTRPPAALLLCLAVCLSLPPCAGGDAPAPPAAMQLSADDRGFFQLGDQLTRAAFAYADLARQAAQVARSHSRLTQVQRLAALAPLADRSRDDARTGFVRAVTLMQSLHATAAALRPVLAAAARLGRPVVLRGDARTVSHFSGDAARTLGSLDEFNALSSLPDDAEVRTWVASPTAGGSGSVWYAEGLIAALSAIAAARQMPELLPPVREIATDLRGLRDWLTLRLPDPPTTDQTALTTSIDAFLAQTSRTGVPQSGPLTAAQLQSLGDISHRLYAQVLGSDDG